MKPSSRLLTLAAYHAVQRVTFSLPEDYAELTRAASDMTDDDIISIVQFINLRLSLDAGDHELSLKKYKTWLKEHLARRPPA